MQKYFRFVFAICIVGNLTTPAFAQTDSKGSSIQAYWYQPEIRPQSKKGYSLIRLSGRTVPKSKIKISADQIPLVTKKNEVKGIQVKKVTDEKEVVADSRGNFEFLLNLPFYTAQLPITIQSPKGKIRNFQLSLDVNEEDVKIMNQENVKNSPYARRKWGLWGGLGYNYLEYSQQVPSIPSDIAYESFKAPALYFKAVRSLNKDWIIQTTANSSPGETKSSSSIQVTDGDYSWTFVTADATYFHPKWKKLKKKLFHEFGVQAGLQYHIVPFLTRVGTTTAEVDTNSLVMAGIGGTWLAHYGRYWLFEMYMRYQYPVSTGDTFEIASSTTYDGSLGIVYKTKPNQRLGVFWYGQSHSYDFENATDKSNGNKVKGSQELFFSDLELRFGIEFD